MRKMRLATFRRAIGRKVLQRSIGIKDPRSRAPPRTILDPRIRRLSQGLRTQNVGRDYQVARTRGKVEPIHVETYGVVKRVT